MGTPISLRETPQLKEQAVQSRDAQGRWHCHGATQETPLRLCLPEQAGE